MLRVDISREAPDRKRSCLSVPPAKVSSPAIVAVLKVEMEALLSHRLAAVECSKRELRCHRRPPPAKCGAAVGKAKETLWIKASFYMVAQPENISKSIRKQSLSKMSEHESASTQQSSHKTMDRHNKQHQQTAPTRQRPGEIILLILW